VSDPRQKAFERALKSISVRERTQGEVEAFLARRGYETGVVEDVVRALREEGLVDDAGYARRFAEDRRLLDSWGNERIARDLERRGVERELVDQALAGHGAEDQLALAIELLDRRFPLPFDGDRERDKAWRMLVRRGYEPELAYSAIRKHEQGLLRCEVAPAGVLGLRRT
jgi:regulatory protein